MSEPTPRTDALLREGEAQYFDNGGALSVEQRDKLFTLAIDLCTQLERTLAAQRTAPASPLVPGLERAAEQEQCFYCKQWYPKPVSYHHSEDDCK